MNGIRVIGIRSAISTISSFTYFNNFLPLKLKCSYLLNEKVIDQICERDFYYGLAGSGISVLKEGKILKSPYFIPFGDPVSRASIPEDKKIYFSKKCILRSLLLWQEIIKLSQKEIYNRDLPEPILNSDENELIIKTLKKEYQKL